MTDRRHLRPLPDLSGRGFTHLPEIPSNYGGHIRAYESSAASSPHLWVRIECPENPNAPDGPTREAVVHLTLDNARRLAEQLVYLVDTHYLEEQTDE